MAGILSEGQREVLKNAVADQLRGIFTDNPLWELERVLGNGAFGITVLLRDKGAMKFGQLKTGLRKHRRVVLKRAIYRQAGIRDFDNEVNAIWKVKGLAHHAQVIAATLDVSEYRSKSTQGFRDAFRNLFSPFKNPPTNIFTLMGPYKGPAILLEYIENGSMLSFILKVWVVRGVCGLVYEQQKPAEGQPPVTEIIPEDGVTVGLLHGDIASRNIMIGEWQPEVEEHRIAPILKYIDYGFAAIANNPAQALRENLFWASTIMLFLINEHAEVLDFDNVARSYKGIQTYAANIIPITNGFNPNPHLDEELRDLLAETMRVNVELRPTLPEVMRRIQNGMKKQPFEYRFREFEESNVAIEARLRQLLHDA
ncbi:hypothetical protein CHU98_g9444 [Xylaria longipes]|nr:hypothetical protein CHU98_g9444 [Xylaria longipes]